MSSTRVTYRRPLTQEEWRRAESEIHEPMANMPGFRAWYTVRLSDTEYLSVTVHDSEADLRAALVKLTPVFQSVYGDNIAKPPERTEGETVAQMVR